MKPIKVAGRVSFRVCHGYEQTCSFCGKKMYGKIGLSIGKKAGGYTGNVWICLECLPKFLEEVKKAYEHNKSVFITELI